MLWIKLLISILVVWLVESVPVNDRKNSDGKISSTRRGTLEAYAYNHSPSIAIPVSIVFEEKGYRNDKSSDSVKPATEISNKKPEPLQEPSSVAIPDSVIFEEEQSVSNQSAKPAKISQVTLDEKPVHPQESSSIAIPVSVVLEKESFVSDESEKSDNLNPKSVITTQFPAQKPSFEAIPVSVVFEEQESQNDKSIKSRKQNLEITSKEPATSYEKLTVGVPVSLIFEEEGVRNNNALKFYNLSPDGTIKNHISTKEPKKEESSTGSIILTSSESVISKSNIEEGTTNIPQTAENNLKEKKSKVRRKLQPRQFQLEYQIPVAVVYDEPINIKTSRRLKSSKNQVRMHSSRRRRPSLTSKTEANIETTTVIEYTQNVRTRQRVNQTQDKENIQFSEHENQNIQPKHREDKSKTTIIPYTTEAISRKLTSNKETISKTPLQTQNRNSSFKAQQKEERRQDNESAKKRPRNPVVPIIKSDSHTYGNSGSFSYSYEGGDGTKAFEKGELKTFEDNKTGEAVVGGFSYKDKDGNDISLSYTADENGYHPVGDHLPTPPPIPVAIQRSLEYLATKNTAAPVTEAGEV